MIDSKNRRKKTDFMMSVPEIQKKEVNRTVPIYLLITVNDSRHFARSENIG